MKNLVCVDFMDTLVRPPTKEVVQHWMDKTEFGLSDFQKCLLRCGFPFAAYANSPRECETLKRTMLVAGEAETLSLLRDNGHAAETRADFTREYIRMFISESSVEHGVGAGIERLCKNSDVKLVSNLYWVYKPLLERLTRIARFDDILLSCDIGYAKPDVRIFRRASFLNYENRYFIGDNWKSDISLPLRMGFQCVYLHPEDPFMQEICQSDLRRFIAIYGEEGRQKIAFREQYRERADFFFADLLNVNHINLFRDVSFRNGKVSLRVLQNAHCVSALADGFRVIFCLMEGDGV